MCCAVDFPQIRFSEHTRLLVSCYGGCERLLGEGPFFPRAVLPCACPLKPSRDRVLDRAGCAGAALWRRKYGETLEKMVTRFPYWLCRNAHKFVGQEDDLPVDQHM